MKRVLFVIASLDYSGAARQLMLLASGLARERFEVRVCVLGGASPWSEELTATGIEVATLGRTRFFDLAPFFALRHLLRSFQPDVVHVWGASALRAGTLIAGVRKLWVSAALPPLAGPARLDAWQLRRVSRVVAFSAAESGRYQALGVPQERIAVVPPAVVSKKGSGVVSPNSAPDTLMQNLTGRVVMVIGPLRPHKGVRDAIWSLDMMHHVYPTMQLVLVGEQPPPRELDGLPPVTDLHFAGRCAEVSPYLDGAEIVWAPGRAGGVSAVLEAMAAGKPVVAGRTAAMAEIIEDGVSGYLFPLGDKPELGRCTRRLLDEPDRRRAMGEAARRRVVECFTPERQMAAYVTLLDGA